jgi:hypothetical protein
MGRADFELKVYAERIRDPRAGRADLAYVALAHAQIRLSAPAKGGFLRWWRVRYSAAFESRSAAYGDTHWHVTFRSVCLG